MGHPQRPGGPVTAEIAVMNKEAVALAADSAVTMPSGKVFFSANKLFALSRNEPVAAMIYGNYGISRYSETVGGPIDVALISKGDGLIWIKRKHYFAPELNQQFFHNKYPSTRGRHEK